jgi:predicted house-cleaning noncanonical NTP pyrophosphatase (MazG superfamily)
MKRHPDGYLVKLVRDQVESALGGDGTIAYRPMSPEEHKLQLRQKLIEEAAEYIVNPSLRELAHVLAVVRALARIDLEVPFATVRTAEITEHVDRGGFALGIGMYAKHPVDTESVS